jgi:hypothetical protein
MELKETRLAARVPRPHAQGEKGEGMSRVKKEESNIIKTLPKTGTYPIRNRYVSRTFGRKVSANNETACSGLCSALGGALDQARLAAAVSSAEAAARTAYQFHPGGWMTDVVSAIASVRVATDAPNWILEFEYQWRTNDAR